MTGISGRRLALAAALAVAATARASGAVGAPSAVGFWVTQDGQSVVQIAECANGLCGTLVGLRHDHAPGEIPKDVKNPDPAKRSAPLCGLLMMGSFQPAAGEGGKWKDGWVYDPEGGRTYSGQVTLEGANSLKLRGYVGIPMFGRSESWTRETGTPNRCAA
jgi:uncharacterized protein (DUF2147 family)